MPDLRKDPVTGRWVIISTQRAKRPQEFIREPVRFKAAHCAFCPGHEDKTPPEIMAYRADAGAETNAAGWKVRAIITTKKSAASIATSLTRRYAKKTGTRAWSWIRNTSSLWRRSRRGFRLRLGYCRSAMILRLRILPQTGLPGWHA